MSYYQTYIVINNHNSYRVTGLQNVLDVDVAGEVPYDRDTRVFKKYTHKIKPPEEGHKGNDNVIYLYDRSYWFEWFRYRFTYYYPKIMLKSVELYFPFSDKKNTTPLVVGINEEGIQTPKYHTYNFLRGLGKSYNYFPSKSFKKEDLLTRLTEELSLYTGTRRNKMVIKSELKSNLKKSYPNTGMHPNKITITKSGHTGYENFEKYEHTINPNSTVSIFYLSRNNDVIYINAEKVFEKGLKSAEFYFYNRIIPKIPLIVKFVGKSDPNLKKYYSIRELFSNKESEIKLETIKEIEVSNLKSKLDEEADFNKGIIWHHINKSGPHSNIVSFSLAAPNRRDSFVEYSHTKDINLKDKFVKILLNNNILNLGERSLFYKIEGLTSYYLTMGPENDQEDETPFLITLTQLEGAGYSRSKIAYYSKKSDLDQKWSELKINGYPDLMVKLLRINEIAKSQKTFPKFREKVYKILNTEIQVPRGRQESSSKRHRNPADRGSRRHVLGSGSVGTRNSELDRRRSPASGGSLRRHNGRQLNLPPHPPSTSIPSFTQETENGKAGSKVHQASETPSVNSLDLNTESRGTDLRTQITHRENTRVGNEVSGITVNRNGGNHLPQEHTDENQHKTNSNGTPQNRSPVNSKPKNGPGEPDNVKIKSDWPLIGGCIGGTIVLGGGSLSGHLLYKKCSSSKSM